MKTPSEDHVNLAINKYNKIWSCDEICRVK